MTQRALVTGSCSGLGAAFVSQLVAEDWEVLGIDQARDEASDHDSIQADLSDPAGLDDVIARCAAAGPFDRVILNAGISATGRFEEIPLEAHLKVLVLNAEATILMTHGLMRAGAVHHGGDIVIVSSLSHFVGYPGAASYAASKDAVAAYAKSVRKPFFRDHGVRVTLACPGPMRTDQAARHSPAGADPERRTAPDFAARVILKAADAGRGLVVPGAANKLAMAAGWLVPDRAARQMRKRLFERLDGEVW